MVIIQRPKTLPEAYSAGLEWQNLTMRNSLLHAKTGINYISIPNNTDYKQGPTRWQYQNSRGRDCQ